MRARRVAQRPRSDANYSSWPHVSSPVNATPFRSRGRAERLSVYQGARRGSVHCSVSLCPNTDGLVGPFPYPRLGFLERLRIADVAPATVAERMKQKTMLNKEANLLPMGNVRGPRRLELAMHPRRRLSTQGTGPWAWGEQVQGSLERSPAITADEREQYTMIGVYVSLRHNL